MSSLFEQGGTDMAKTSMPNMTGPPSVLLQEPEWYKERMNTKSTTKIYKNATKKCTMTTNFNCVDIYQYVWQQSHGLK